MNRQQDRDKDRGTWAALLMLLSISLALVLFISIVFPNVIYVFSIVFGFGLLFVLQYLIWGRWLTGYLKDRIPDDSEEEEEFLKKYGPQ